ncbi:PLP-dependent transferase [Patescibacteria group bacterium]
MEDHNSPDQHILERTTIDLSQDVEEIRYLCTSLKSCINDFKQLLNQTKIKLIQGTYEKTTNHLQLFDNQLIDIEKQINNFQKLFTNKTITTGQLNLHISQKYSLYEQLRILYGVFGSLRVSTDWQSPSFYHSKFSQAGVQTGKIKGTINDYKRDQHLDGHMFEKLFIKEYIDAPKHTKQFIHAFATNSGMGAFSTIFNYLLIEKKLLRPVLVGSTVYFQYKQLLVDSLDKQIVIIDESDTTSIIKAIQTHEPSAIFLDSLGNDIDMKTPDIDMLLSYLQTNAKKDTFFILDNCTMSAMYQPFRKWVPTVSKLRLVVFESLNKYHQFGMDRVMGGIIYCSGYKIDRIFDYRENLGTNITDNAIYSIPTPNKKQLTKRMNRIERNALLISSSLQQHISVNETPIESIIYPGLPHYHSFKRTTSYDFHGGFFALQFKPKYQSVKTYQKFQKSVIHIAKEKNIQIIAGTSFGLSTSRIYLTALRSDVSEPFIRIAVGTETTYEVKQLIVVFTEAINTL